MAFHKPSRITSLVLSYITTLATGNGVDVIVVPCDMDIFYVHMTLGTTGGTSGNTDVVVNYTAPSGGATTSGNLWTVGTGVGRIPYNATSRFLTWDRDSMAITRIEAGGTLSLNISSVPTTASSNLVITLYGYPTDQ